MSAQQSRRSKEAQLEAERVISDRQRELERTRAFKIDALARAESEAIRIKTVAEATAESIRKVNLAIKEGGEAYFRYRQIEMLPDLVPVIADALPRREWSPSRATGATASSYLSSARLKPSRITASDGGWRMLPSAN